MLRIAICDDIKDCVQQVADMVDNWSNKPENTICQCFDNGDDLLNAHLVMPFDIILLDIVMPLENGIEVAREIRQNDKNVKIVFLTSSPEFAIDSYTVKANNYLLKPVDPQKLHQCLDECYTDILDRKKAISIKSTTGIHHVKLHTIEHIEAQGKLVLFTLSGGHIIHAVDPFYVYENLLLPEDGFFKCHRSYLVNIYWINSFDSKQIIMQSGYRIPIARSCQKTFEAAYFSLLFGKADDLQ